MLSKFICWIFGESISVLVPPFVYKIDPRYAGTMVVYQSYIAQRYIMFDVLSSFWLAWTVVLWCTTDKKVWSRNSECRYICIYVIHYAPDIFVMTWSSVWESFLRFRIDYKYCRTVYILFLLTLLVFMKVILSHNKHFSEECVVIP